MHQTATNGNDQLLNAWASCDIITEWINTRVAPTYQENYDLLMSIAKKLEDSDIDNCLDEKVNVAESDYIQPYSPSDDNHDTATGLSLYMEVRGGDIGMIYGVLNCSKALQQGKYRPQERARQSPRESLRKDL